MFNAPIRNTTSSTPITPAFMGFEDGKASPLDHEAESDQASRLQCLQVCAYTCMWFCFPICGCDWSLHGALGSIHLRNQDPRDATTMFDRLEKTCARGVVGVIHAW